MHQLLPLLKVRVPILALLGLAPLFAAHYAGLPYGVALLILEFLIIFLNQPSWEFLCRQKIKPKWAVNLNGKWSGSIISKYKKLETDEPLPPILSSLKIKQNWLCISVKLETEKITSKSKGPLLEYDADNDELCIKYFYETTPAQAHTHENPPQKLGCAYLIIDTNDPKKIRMSYTNERSPGGDAIYARS